MTESDRRRAWAIDEAVRAGFRPNDLEFDDFVEFNLHDPGQRRRFEREEAVRDLKAALRESPPMRGLRQFVEWLARRF